MRLYEFTLLIEYKREITQQKLGDRLITAAKRDRNQDIDTILTGLEDIDPTKNKQYVQWLANQYIKNQFRLEDAPRVKEVLVNFNRLKPRIEQKDINRYDFHSLDQTIDQILDVKLDTDNTDVSSVPGVKVLYKGLLGYLAIPETKQASCTLGSGTKWCTAAKENNMFDHYNKQGPLYIWKDRDGSKYQFHFQAGQFMDAQDKPINKGLLNKFRTQHPVLKKLFAEEEKKIASDPDVAIVYARDVIEGLWPEGETAIARDPSSALSYAKHVIKGRWPEGEKAIASDPLYAFMYARDVIKGRWPEGETAIARDPSFALSYAKYIIEGRWPEGEKAIAGDPSSALFYAKYIIEGWWPEGEKAIASKPSSAFMYAQDVIKGRWPEGEEAIASDPSSAFMYALNIIKGRWPEGEEAIASNTRTAKQYRQFLKTTKNT